MKKILISATLASMMMASCQNEVIESQLSGNGDMFTLEVVQGGSRTALDDNLQTVWSNDDKIYVTSEDGKVTGVLSYQGNNKFTGYVFGGDISALDHVIFPVPENGKVVLKQPTGERLDLPMFGEISGASASMRNVCALINLPVEGAANISLTSEGENTLNGHYEYQNGEFVFIPGEGGINVSVNEGKALFAVSTDIEGEDHSEVELKVNGSENTITVPVVEGSVSENNVPEIEITEDGEIEATMNVTNEKYLLEAIAKYDEVKLAGDIELTKTLMIQEGKTLTLDLGGYEITAAVYKDDGAVIDNAGNLTLKGNGTIKNTAVNGGATVNNNGTLVLNGVSVVGAPIAGTEYYPEYAVITAGELTVEAGTITSGRGTIEMKDGADVTINGGNFEVTNAADSRKMTLHVICAKGSESELTINGGNFEYNHNSGSGSSVICPYGATITINGGNFAYNGDKGGNGQNGIFQNYMGYGDTVDVYGGTYNDTTFNGDTYQVSHLAKGYEAVENGDDTWTVQKSAGE